jgi:SHAQKYF class myb-like DNA-binding protein
MFAVSRANNPLPRTKQVEQCATTFAHQSTAQKPKLATKPRFIISNQTCKAKETVKKVEKLEKAIQETERKKKIRFRLAVVRGCRDVNAITETTGSGEKKAKRSKDLKRGSLRRRDGIFHCGRWQPDEHQRFIEAIMKFGNEWKQVQKYVGTRSSTQARSHAQKFFVKIKNSNLLDLNDLNGTFSKNSIKSLHNLASNLTAEEYFNTLQVLNEVAFERKPNAMRRRKGKDDVLSTDSFMNDINSTMNTMCGLR